MKVAGLLALLCIAVVTANPAANTEWRWKTRMPTVSYNPNAVPFQRFIKNVVKQPRVPGTHTVEGCGPTKASSRIVGGSEAIPHSYPWQVALFVDDAWFCGGSIISDEWILTAAHCLDNAFEAEVVAGAHNIQKAEDTQVSIRSTNLIVHEGYNSVLLRNDVGLIRLPTALTFNEFIAPVCLPSYSDENLAVDTIVNPSGWGKPSDSAFGISDVLRQVTNPVISQAACSAVYGGIITDAILCTGTTGGHGTCNGDSGGPVNYVVNGVTYTRGVTSFVSSSGCESGLPDGFSRVTSHLDWIERNTGIIIDP